MSGGSEEFRCFVGGLPWSTTDESLQSKFSEFGKIVDAKVITDRESRRSRGFGFVTFADQQSMDEAIQRQHEKDFDGRIVSVTRARPKAEEDRDKEYVEREHYYDREREHYHYDVREQRDHHHYDRGERLPPPRPVTGDCFKCGKSGHWAKDCYLAPPPPPPPPPPPRPSSYSYTRDYGYGRDRYDSRDYYFEDGPGPYNRERYHEREFRGGPMRKYEYRERDRPVPYDRPPIRSIGLAVRSQRQHYHERAGRPTRY